MKVAYAHPKHQLNQVEWGGRQLQATRHHLLLGWGILTYSLPRGWAIPVFSFCPFDVSLGWVCI